MKEGGPEKSRKGKQQEPRKILSVDCKKKKEGGESLMRGYGGTQAKNSLIFREQTRSQT